MGIKKELSIATMEAFKRNRVKSVALKDGQAFLTITGEGAIYMGHACRCDKCPNVGSVNGGIVDGANTPESELQSMTFCLSKFLSVDEDVGCYDADGSGDVLCWDCYAKRDAMQKSEAQALRAQIEHDYRWSQS
jgi:hypothetical protein